MSRSQANKLKRTAVAARSCEPSDGLIALKELVNFKGIVHELCRDKFYLVYLNHEENSQVFCRRNQTQSECQFRFWPFRETALINYEAFNLDFGPYNLAATHLFCSKLKVWADTMHLQKIYKYIAIVLDENCPKRKLNATLAAGIAAMVLYGMDAQEVCDNIYSYLGESNNYVPAKAYDRRFTDVTGSRCPSSVKLDDSIWGFYYALRFKFYDYFEFDQLHYLYFETVPAGDLNWIIPGKLLAFAGPSDKMCNSRNIHRHKPSFYHGYFKEHNVTSIIRLNEPEYQRSGFTDYGFEHFDLIFPDGLAPTKAIAEEFIKIVEQAKGAVAVHCYAGIGRTGTLIASYLMTKYNMTAQRAIAWTRICRPGSVIGEQEVWLHNNFDKRTMTRIRSKIENFQQEDLLSDNKIKSTTSPQDNINPIVTSLTNPKHEDMTLDYKCNEKLDEPDPINSSTPTSYELAAKTLGQAEALVMTKRQRKGVDRSAVSRKPKLSTALDNEKAATIPTKTKTGTPTPPKSPIAGDIKWTKTAGLVLDLGKTIPFSYFLSDLLDYEFGNPAVYRMYDDGTELKVKFPKSKYVELRHDRIKDFRNGCHLESYANIVVKEPMLEFAVASVGATDDIFHNFLFKPVIYYSSDVV